MFENPTIDIQELRSVLTDAGHTAVGLATMAAKKANDVRLDLTDRYEEQTKDLRSNMLTVVEKFADARAKVEARVEPVLESFTDRLPAPARKVVENLTESAKDARTKAHQLVVDALSVETEKPAVKTSAPTSTPVPKVARTAKAAAARTVAKAERTVAKAERTVDKAVRTVKAKPTVKKVGAKTVAAEKAVVKKAAARKPAARTATAAKPAARKPAARKATAARPAARKAAAAKPAARRATTA